MVIKQGCVFLDLFNFYSEAILRMLDTLSGFIICGLNFYKIRRLNSVVDRIVKETENKE